MCLETTFLIAISTYLHTSVAVTFTIRHFVHDNVKLCTKNKFRTKMPAITTRYQQHITHNAQRLCPNLATLTTASQLEALSNEELPLLTQDAQHFDCLYPSHRTASGQGQKELLGRRK